MLATLTLLLAGTLVSAQGNPVRFIAAPTVARGTPGSSAYKAFAARFSRNGPLDVVFSGVTDNSPNPVNFSETAINQGGGTFATVDNQGGRASDGLTGPDLGADLNGDGITDAITGNQNQIEIQLGAGDGTFSDANFITFAGGTYPNAIATGDFNGDGSIDLAVLTSAGTLVILLNDGDADFHTAFTYKLPAGVAGLLVGDINGDTLADVLLIGSDATGETLTPYLAMHGGALAPSTTYTIAGMPVAIVDVNHDGFADVALVTSTGVQFLLGSASGQLKAGKSIPVTGLTGLIAFADFNNDGVLDLAVAGTLPGPSTPSFVSVYLGNSTGTFGDPTIYGIGNSPVSLIAGDFYGSGRVDLMTFDAGDAGLSLLHNTGGGHFQGALVTHSYNVMQRELLREISNGTGKRTLRW